MSNELFLQALNARATTIDEAIATFEALDRVLAPTDGLKWFNFLYLMVVREVIHRPPAAGWADAEWLTRLDVNFTNLYFDALRASISEPARTPRAWRVLFASRSDDRIMRVQFALCGMNAHINRDLQFALMKTFEETGLSPVRDSGQHRDFEYVNEVLEIVQPAALDILATGMVGFIDEGLGRLDDIIAMWSVRRARETAWFNTEMLWNLRHSAFLRSRHNEIVDRLASLAGRGLIIHL